MTKQASKLSGGEKQRVSIARAIAKDNAMVFADEPTGNLDSQNGEIVMEILKEISYNKLIIMVTHNPELAEQYSNRIVKLKDGLVVSDSNPYISANMAKADEQFEEAVEDVVTTDTDADVEKEVPAVLQTQQLDVEEAQGGKKKNKLPKIDFF